MEIKLNSKELTTKLEQVFKVVNSKSSLPILNDVLIETKGDVVMLTTSDSEMWLSVKCNITSHDQDFKFCINAKDFLNAIKSLNDVPTTITLDEQSKTLTCNYGNGKFQLPYDGTEEFPLQNMNTEDVTSFILDSKRVLKAIELTGFATANDELRPIMNGIHFDFFTDGMVTAASDGYKLARYKDKTITRNDDGTTPNLTLPKKPANVLMTILSATEGEVKMMFNDKAFVINNKDFKITARLLEYKFPNYESVIQKTGNIFVTIDNNALTQALKRVIPMANESSNLVELDFTQGQVTVSAKDVDFSKSASETITCDCDSEIKIGFKGATLIDILRNIKDDNVVIELTEPNRAGVLYSALTLTRDEYLSLCMPMIIQ
jgi:DNA polymerase-3 subunit beta